MKKLLNFLLPTKFKPRHKITNVELQAFRKLFQMDIKFAAELAGCSVQSWYGWEKGETVVPERIGELMDHIQALYIDELASMENAIREHNDRCALRYYETFELFAKHYPRRANLLDWKISQVIAARLLGDESVYLVSAERIEEEICGK
ncbi:DUF1870 family protein [Salmonella enterica subsp. enterica serovar Thompson]|nr:DUF1870 family protein [Salmonella enterica]EHP7187663.1 DUF1870 family protein [Salmonella enterica subsp. enterica serovar Thompson]